MEETSITLFVMDIHNVKSLIDCWPSRKVLADEINGFLPVSVRRVTPDQVHKWAANGSIRATYQMYVLNAAIARGLAVDAELIVSMHAASSGSSNVQSIAQHTIGEAA